jgi:PERQ amino acid-rich with GYF domain-containing protein
MSLSSGQPPLPSRETGLSSPRSRVGFGPSFDGVLNGAEALGARRKVPEGLPKAGATLPAQIDREDSECLDGRDPDIKEEEEERCLGTVQHDDLKSPSQPNPSGDASFSLATQPINKSPAASEIAKAASIDLRSGPPPGIPDLASVEWSYLDPQGEVQGQDPSYNPFSPF